MAIGYFPTFVVCMVPSGTMKASLKGRNFQVRLSSDTLGSVFKVHDVFSNKDSTFNP